MLMIKVSLSHVVSDMTVMASTLIENHQLFESEVRLYWPMFELKCSPPFKELKLYDKEIFCKC